MKAKFTYPYTEKDVLGVAYDLLLLKTGYEIVEQTKYLVAVKTPTQDLLCFQDVQVAMRVLRQELRIARALQEVKK